MIFETNKDKGRAGMALAIAYFGSNGYTVSIPLNDTQWYDLVIEKDGVFQTVQCKATGSKDNTISLKSCGGSTRCEYDNVLNHPVDLLFCLDSVGNMFVIPVDDMRKQGVLKSITLRTELISSNQKFQTYSYRVFLFNGEADKQDGLKLEQQQNQVVKNFCRDCGCKISNRAIRCHSCASAAKIVPIEKMPVTRKELKEMIRTMPFVQIGKRFNVTDNTVRKWCRKYGLPSTKTDINLYSNEEWEDL